MALVWEKQVGGSRYEVRSAGNSLRLYTNGVFHSQFNPCNPVTGDVWDLLMLPAFLQAPETIKRILVLGVGGGTVIRQLHHFLGPRDIVGIELNPVHLQVARRFFKARGEGVRLYRADAVKWVRHYGGAPFDMIIDDLYGEAEAEPSRAVSVDAQWCRSLLRHLAPGGVYVANFVCRQELLDSACCTDARIRAQFKTAFEFTTSQSKNAVGAFLRRPADRFALNRNLQQIPLLDPRRKTCKLRYRIRKI